MDIEKAITRTGLTTNEVAEHLFPNNKHPYHALKRVMDGHALLNTDQASKLAVLASLTIAELFHGGWSGSASENQINFQKDGYTVSVDTSIWNTRIYHNASLIHEQIIHNGHIALSKFLSTVDQIIERLNG